MRTKIKIGEKAFKQQKPARWLLRLGLIFLSTALTAGGVWFWPKQLIFPIRNSETVAFLDGSTASRDLLGFWSVKSSNVTNAYHALGYVFASDRLFQLDLARRASAGKLSELFGEKTLELDRFNRNFGYEALAETDSGPAGWLFLQENQELKLELESFIQGVNEYVSMIQNKFWYWPPEYRILRSKPTPFSIKDAFLAMSSMQLYFNSARKSDLSNSHILSKAPKLAALFFGDLNPIQMSAEAYLKAPIPSEVKPLTEGRKPSDHEFLSPNFIEKIWAYSRAIGVTVDDHYPTTSIASQAAGSNAWMCEGSRMQDGYSALANDPHLALGIPSFLNFARIETPNFEIMGAFIPLSPYPVIGMSKNGAWGMTFSELDQADFYQGTMNAESLEDATEVKFGDVWVPLEKRQETIKVSGHAAISAVYAKTDKAVVLNNTFLNPAVGNRQILLSADVSLSPGNRHLQSVRNLALSATKEDFRNSIKYNRAPPQNVFWVGSTGELAWGVAGWMAERDWKFEQVLRTYFPNYSNKEIDSFVSGHSRISHIPGSLVMPYSPGFMWTGVHAAADIVYSDQFSSGCMGNANEQITNDIDAKPSLASTNWAIPVRSKRIKELLSSQDKFDEQSFMKFQTDIRDNFADELVPILLNLRLSSLNSNGKAALNRLKEWDRLAAINSKGQLEFELLMFNWRKDVLQKVAELSEDIVEMHGKQNSKILLSWANMILSDQRQVSTDQTTIRLLTSALEKSLNDLPIQYSQGGFNWESSTWGDFHTFGPEHTLASIPVLGRWFKYPSFPIPGSTYSLAVQSYQKTFATTDFRSKSGAGLRFIAMPEKGIAWAMFPSGASGVPGASEFYKNQENYISGKYYKLNLNSASSLTGKHLSQSQ